ncbi:MAG: hypothetical protein WCJ81_06430 [bacterium]
MRIGFKTSVSFLASLSEIPFSVIHEKESFVLDELLAAFSIWTCANQNILSRKL